MHPIPRQIVAPAAVVLILVLVACGCGRGPQPGDEWRANDEFVRAFNRGVCLMEQYKYNEAVAAFEEARDLSPDSIETRVHLAIAEVNNSRSEGSLERAETLLDEILEDAPEDPRALYLRGILYIDAGEPETAIPFLEKVVEQEPDDDAAWYVLGRAKKNAEQPAKAEFLRAIELNPWLGSAWYDLFTTERNAGNMEAANEALETFKRVIAEPFFKNMLELPRYRRMGDLGVVRPLAVAPDPVVSSAELSFGEPRTLFETGVSTAPWMRSETFGLMLAAGDVEGDGDHDLITIVYVAEEGHRLLLLRNEGEQGYTDATDAAELSGVDAPASVAFGDYDNDGFVDLFVACEGPNRLFHGNGDGTFADVTAEAGAAGGTDVASASAVFLDADHDADLDVYVCNFEHVDGSPAANQLLRNNADGTFTDVAAEVGVACADVHSVSMAPIDLDDDRYTDLIVFHADAPLSVFRNELHEGYRAFSPADRPVSATAGGVAQDFDGDGLADLLVFGHGAEPAGLYLGRGAGRLEPSEQFAGDAEPLASAGTSNPMRVVDVDLDGDLDVAVLADKLLLYLNDGWGRFVRSDVASPDPGRSLGPVAELVDFTGDGVVDLLAVDPESPGTLSLFAGELSLPATWLGISPTGNVFAEKMRSPKGGLGTKVDVRTGVHGQVITHTGLHGGLGQSTRPLVFGLDGASRTDYVALRWPDGVTQTETDLASNQHHVVAENQRKPDSCPMLFAWNGTRFGFVGDFAGVGGLGYYAGEGDPPPPQVKELVRIRADQLVARDGRYELRVGEPMQEVAYVDRLELLAVDHLRGREVQPDERLVLTGSAPTQELLNLGRKVFPVRAAGPDGPVEIEDLREADRRYAYEPAFDHRFVGYCEPHELVVEFGDELAALDPDLPTYLCFDGTLEFPYSQTNFAAGQAGVTWDAPRLDLRTEDGSWKTLVADTGAPGGMMRTVAVDVTGKLPAGPCALRLTANLELYYDRVFLAQDRGREELVVRTVPMVSADLRRLGFPQEFSPDGGHPHLYDYDNVEATCHLQRLPGRYTRYGAVDELLGEFDDRYVVMATGDEIAVDFDAAALPPAGDGRERTFVLVSHAYCKDLDLHSVGPRTVDPLPFRGMTGYPYPAEESYPSDEVTRRYLSSYNSRIVR